MSAHPMLETPAHAFEEQEFGSLCGVCAKGRGGAHLDAEPRIQAYCFVCSSSHRYDQPCRDRLPGDYAGLESSEMPGEGMDRWMRTIGGER